MGDKNANFLSEYLEETDHVSHLYLDGDIILK
jgi:hypothetical protein